MNEQNVVFNLLAFFLSFVGVKIVASRTGPGAMEGDGRIVGCVKFTTPEPVYPGSGAPAEDYIAYEEAYALVAEYLSFS